MKIAVLMTNTDESDFAGRHPKDGEKFTDFIHLVRPDWHVAIYAVKDGTFPTDIGIYDGFIITGSPASVNDDAEWIKTLLNLIQVIAAQKIPMFGACFGHQAIAVALGGSLVTNPDGWGHGVLKTSGIAQFPWGGDMGDIVLYGSHIEQVSTLPKEAVSIAKSDGCEIAGFVIENHIFTIQHHPEMTHEFICALVDELAEYVGPAVTQNAKKRLKNARADRAQFANWVVQFFEHGVLTRPS